MADLGQGIRPYGPGKFSTILDSYVYDVSLDGGCDMETGDASEMGWYGLMRHGHTIFKDHDPDRAALNDDEQDALRKCAGCILREDSQGFVYVTYYETMPELDKAWAEIELAEINDEEGDSDV